MAVRVPHQRLGHCVSIPPPPLPKPKTKGWLEAGCLPGGGTQCVEAGRPDDRGPPITCPLDENERQGASGAYVSECVTLGFTSRLGGGVGGLKQLDAL